MDTIFKALADPARRTLLDALRQRDGQSLADLTELLDMSRFGVMKHLGVLEDAGLIVSRKRGRFKYHYLNALPLQEAIDRWIEPLLVKPATRAALDLKTRLESETAMTDTDTDTLKKPDFVLQTFIRCTQDALWDALSDPAQMAAYHFLCNRVDGEAAVDTEMRWLRDDGSVMFRQTALSITPKSRIEATFEPDFFGPDAKASHMAFLIEAEGPLCKLTIEHFDIPAGQDGVREGWARFAGSLKSWLETGQPLKMEM
ncbi:metalloregulator ArsR/SmtB family transcription factor [Sulfitobacter albidus]|uniref:Metalloregulator ArsR/SmtB family transcription factor n=1 Tax=Sulfitobacter albidus TaxID=2829501 RepID=A0A975PMS7_9RHOB|nr:metalloregulator ArsR/SmtB family transcription factor [Sulfitobacter albidus]QUJ77118.1 metalloregulator ArsR/SmtB family transcription factor [Sulfitobacter albidus]